MGGLTPWFKFYPGDWQSDQQLRICSLAARGLWIECMAIMHKASPYGHLLVNGQPLTDAQIAMLVGTSPDQLSPLMAELENAGVFSRTRTGVIYSRRMTRDEKRRKDGVKSKISGRIEGSRRSKQATENKCEKLPPTMVVGMVASKPPSTQISEVRDQKERKISCAIGQGPPHVTFDDFWREYPSRGKAANPRKPAEDKFDRLVKSGVDPGEIVRGLKAYSAAQRSLGNTGERAQFIMQATKFLNQEVWKDYLPAPTTNGHGPTPPKSPEEAAIRLKAGRDRGQWPRAQWGPAPGEEGCLIPPELIQPADKNHAWDEWERRGS